MSSQPSALAKELSAELGADKALSAAISLLLNETESSKSFSMLNGTPGVATGLVSSKSGRVLKSKVADLLRSLNISANIEETNDGEFVFDVTSHEATKLRTLCDNEDAEFSFEILSSPPVLRFDAPGLRPDGGSKRGGPRGGSRDRSFRDDRGYRPEGDRFRSGRDHDRGSRGRDSGSRGRDSGGRGRDSGDRSSRGGSYADRPRDQRRSPGRGSSSSSFDRDGDSKYQKKESRNDLNFDFLFD